MSNSQIKMASWRKVSGIGLPTWLPTVANLQAGARHKSGDPQRHLRRRIAAPQGAQLPPPFHRDPADQLLVATARVFDCR
jgi:hypothetical protein